MSDVRPGEEALRRARIALTRLASRQRGLATRRQLLALGFTKVQLERMVADGRLVRVHRGVYAVGHAALTREARWLAATLACGDGAVLSHRAAAALWDLGHLTSSIVDVTVPHARRTRHGIAVHHARLDPRDVTQRRGIPVTSPSRTLLDLAGTLDRMDLARVVEQAMRLRVYDRTNLDATLERAHGRRELKALRAVLDDLDPIRARTRFELERRALVLIAKANLPKPRVNEHVAGHEVDLHWPAHRLVVELDSRTWHSDPEAFERDRRRDGDLLEAGWRVLRVTWRQLTQEPADVAARIGRLLA